jgi:hypothetical protein
MNYVASISDFFKTPRCAMNTLLAGLCVLIPFIGPIVILGWLITGFWGRDDERFETFPEFGFGHFGKYLERGLWPFLVTLVVSLIMLPVIFVLMIAGMLTGALFSDGGEHGNSWLAAIVWILLMLLYLLMMGATALLIAPFKVRASLTQDFAKSFDLGFAKRFIALTWKEIILSWIFMMLASIVLTFLGLLVFCIGMYFAFVPVYFCWTHLNKQLYTLYLSRGGEPVPQSPKLRDGPPPLPTTA